jgi:hypothetical protein
VNTATAWCGDQLAQRFHDLHDVLRRHEVLWRPQAFQQVVLPWETQFPELSTRLRALDYDRAEALAEDDAALVELLRADFPELPALHAALELPPMALEPLPELAEAVAVPGRKWSQIKAFAACVPAHTEPLLEWCAGKAHLGRLLATLQRRAALVLEWDAELVASGADLARRAGLPIEFHCVDVLDDATATLVRRGHDIVALHACGELHLQLLRNCATRQPRALLLAPCCYQLIATESYEPLSRLAQAHDLQLTIADLHTAVRDSVTSPQRVREQRKTLQAWRLGFDSWQRTARGVNTYVPTPSLPLSMSSKGFENFCREVAAHNGIAFDPAMDREYYEAAGWRRLREVTALDLPRIAFRRALELWLVLDRALYLQEHGYDVEIGRFCERALTPRNILIRAQRRADQ